MSGCGCQKVREPTLQSVAGAVCHEQRVRPGTGEDIGGAQIQRRSPPPGTHADPAPDAKYEVGSQHEGATSIEWMRVPRFISNPIDRDATTSDATDRVAKAIDPRQSAIVTALTRVSASGGVANPSHTVAASAITASNGTTRTEKYANS